MKVSGNMVTCFRKAFETKCITLLISAYNASIANHNYSTDWMENDFTSMLDEYLEKNPQRIKWKYSCNIEHHLHKKGLKKERGFANSEDRIDMRISTFSSLDEYLFYVEAKLIKEKSSDLLNRYIRTGIDHYISKKYPQGIMLGYLLEGNVDIAINKINAILIRKNRGNEVLRRKQHLVHNQYFESTHLDFGVISHFVLDYTL